jgi:hypothetical protein
MVDLGKWPDLICFTSICAPAFLPCQSDFLGMLLACFRQSPSEGMLLSRLWYLSWDLVPSQPQEREASTCFPMLSSGGGKVGKEDGVEADWVKE